MHCIYCMCVCGGVETIFRHKHMVKRKFHLSLLTSPDLDPKPLSQ